MPPDKFSATWVSHSSMSDFLACPRSYYLKNVYRDPKNNHKIQLMSPPLALGSAVHEVVESLSQLPTADRFKESLLSKYEQAWEKVSGKRGGFHTSESEEFYKDQGRQMIKRVIDNPGPVARKSIKIKSDLPQYWLSEEEAIILCGKIDWLEYLPESDSVHIIDFKTGKNEEDGSSLQLPIYHLLVHNTQSRRVTGASYWYLRFKDEPDEQQLPELESAHQEVMQIAKKVKLARKLENFPCPNGSSGCFACKKYEQVIRGEAEFVGENSYRADIYVLPEPDQDVTAGQSVIL